ncbi:MAG: pyridoxamine 5'-phosphate oxidase family protein [Acidimicrobiales bacterium]
MTELATIAPAFRDMAHRIVWCTAATVDASGRPRTRVLHPIWEWTDGELTGWIATSPNSVKAKHLAHQSALSLTYWDTSHDTCTADCDSSWETGDAVQAGWDRFANGPAPVGYDPSIIPQWTSAEVADFGVLRLTPTRLRVMPGTLMTAGSGELLSWRR